jgi:hypothetical protein
VPVLRSSALTAVPALVVAVVTLAGCGAATTDAGTTTPVRTGVDGSLSALTDKIDSIALDECATKTPATVFPNCPRFVAEVGNVAVAVTGAAPGRPGAAAMTSSATAVGQAVSTFIGHGCVASSSGPAPSAAVCGPDLQEIQTDLKAMQEAVNASAG